jgi:hypothetical protein
MNDALLDLDPSARGLRLVEPGGLFRAIFRVKVQKMP